MAVLQTGQSFSSGDQVTATKLEDIANLATFRTGTNQTADDSTIQVDGSGGYLKVKSGGISSNELATDSVITAKIQDDAVTSDKLAHISNLNVLGNVSGSTAAPIGVEIKDEDNMASDSATALATQQSIKAYVDTEISTVNVGGIAASFIATPTSANLQSTTEVDIFNETVSLDGTRSIHFKISYSAGGATTNEWKLYVDNIVIDQSNLALANGFSGVATLMASSAALGTNAEIRVTNRVQSGNVTKTLVNTAKLIII